MDWFTFWFNSFFIAAQGCLQMFFSSRFTGKKLKAGHLAVYVVLLAMTAALSSNIVSAAASLLALYVANRFLLGSGGPVSCVTAVLAVYVTWLSGGIVNSLALLLFPSVPISMMTGYLIAWLTLLCSLALCLLCYKLISNHFPIEDSVTEPYIWMLLPVLFFLAVEFYLFYTGYEKAVTVPIPRETVRQLTLLTLHLLSLGALFCTLYACRRISESFCIRAACASLEQETRAQKAYVAQAQMRYEQTRAFRHDIKNHLSILDGLLKNGRFDQARGYLRDLESVTGELSFPVHTGNPILDILLGEKLEPARAGGIFSEVSLVMPESCQVDDLDLCVIFANAVDNAIQACLALDGTKRIDIRGRGQGDFYMIEFENTCSPEAGVSEGTGLANIKTAAKKYAGAVAWEKTGSRFVLSVLLNISAHPGDHSIRNS